MNYSALQPTALFSTGELFPQAIFTEIQAKLSNTPRSKQLSATTASYLLMLGL